MEANACTRTEEEVGAISEQNDAADQKGDVDNERPDVTGDDTKSADTEAVVAESVTGAPKTASTKAESRQISISVRTLGFAALAAVAVAAAVIPSWLYFGERAKVNAQERQVANYHHAEQIALDYAAKAARIDYQDLDGWKKNLVDNTTPELGDKLAEAGTSMEQLLVPLQWNSTATPLVAKVRSDDNGIYVVDTFVGVNTKTMQAPEGLQSTATYSVTVDSNHDWQISEVGGIGSVVGPK